MCLDSTWKSYVPLEPEAERKKFNLDKMKAVKKWNINNLQSERRQGELRGSVGSSGNKLKIWKLIYDASARLNLTDSFKSLFSFLYFSRGKRQLTKINDRCSAKNKNICYKLRMMSNAWGKMKGEPVVREATVFWGTLCSLYGVFAHELHMGFFFKGVFHRGLTNPHHHTHTLHI